MTDFPNPNAKLIDDYSIEIMEDALSRGNRIYFDLTHVEDLSGVLRGTGHWANKVTSIELRYLRDNADRFGPSVTFLKDGKVVGAPF